MLSVLDDIYRSMRVKNNDSVHALFLDFEKAFDKVNHHVLLAKLWKLEIRGKLFSVIQSYLSNRKQFAVVDGVCSSTLEKTSGVPQGSLLGPLLFIIFINDIPASVENGFTSLFADDVEISYINSSATDIQLDLKNLHGWAVSNSMKFSSTKCNAITFKRVPLNIKIADFNISSNDSEKYLGIIITERLSWTEHIRERCLKANRAFFMIMRSCANELPLESKLKAMQTMVIPILTYASQVYYLTKTDMKLLESVQRRCTRWIAGSSMGFKERLIKLNLLPITLYIQMHDLFLLSNILNGKFDYGCSKFIRYANQLSTRGSERVCFKFPQHMGSEANFRFRTPKLVNMLPESLQFFETRGLKQRLSNFFYNYFIAFYEEERPCTWIVACKCSNCRNIDFTYLNYLT